MKNLLNKVQLASRIAAGSFFMVAVMAAPQASAHDVAAERIKQLEQSLQAIQVELQRMKSESAQAAQKVKSIEQTTSQTEQKINSLEERKAAFVERTDIKTERIGSDITEKTRMLHFRGGFAHMMNHRNGVSIQSQVSPVGAQDQPDKQGWYVGAGIDWGLTRDMWGLMPKTTVFAELMFEYKQFGAHVLGNGAVGNAPSVLAGGAVNPINVTVSQFTVSASPKIKFFEGSKIRPWVIPAGLAVHVMSPPSESITVLAPGVQFGAGVDYNIWKDFFIGIEGRYHLTAGRTDNVNLSGMTAGGYVGIGF
ncbi:porin family protein [Nitrosomonas sp.]|uniref:porin family protein n=1 Tax=Nitrosomonas sp. TaxID=42353 RepID=UPI0025D5CC6B|nr:porin family protein [Nitrosomonas sp.]MBY0484139.1 porin family protein [Nitrosomonas sp.]